MKKVAYAFILLLCLAGGLSVGLIRQRGQHADAASGGGGDIEISNTGAAGAGSVSAGSPGGDVSAVNVNMAAASSPTPAALNIIGSGDASAANLPPSPASTPAASDISGRADDPSASRPFAAGSDPSPVKASHGSRHSGGGDASFDSGSGGSRRHHGSSSGSSGDSLPSIPSHQTVSDSGKFGTENFADPTPRPRGRKGKAAPTPAPEVAKNDVEDLPTVDNAPAAGTPTPEAAPPPPRFASIPPSMGANGDLIFGEGSKSPFLKKITQRQNGDRSVVHIDFTGSARYRVFRLRNPNRVWVDFDETELPGGQTAPAPGTATHVKEISALQRVHADGTETARVQILLNDAELPSVSPVGEQEGQGGIDVVIGGGSNEKF